MELVICKLSGIADSDYSCAAERTQSPEMAKVATMSCVCEGNCRNYQSSELYKEFNVKRGKIHENRVNHKVLIIGKSLRFSR